MNRIDKKGESKKKFNVASDVPMVNSQRNFRKENNGSNDDIKFLRLLTLDAVIVRASLHIFFYFCLDRTCIHLTPAFCTFFCSDQYYECYAAFIEKKSPTTGFTVF